MAEYSSSDLLLLIQIPHRFVHALMRNHSGLVHITLNRTDIRTLITVKEYGPAPMKQLAKMVGMAKGSFTQVIDKLVKMELVIRSDNPEDRRVVLISITEKGRDLKHELDQELVIYLKERLEVFTDTEKEELLNALKTIGTITEKLNKN